MNPSKTRGGLHDQACQRIAEAYIAGRIEIEELEQDIEAVHRTAGDWLPEDIAVKYTLPMRPHPTGVK